MIYSDCRPSFSVIMRERQLESAHGEPQRAEGPRRQSLAKESEFLGRDSRRRAESQRNQKRLAHRDDIWKMGLE